MTFVAEALSVPHEGENHNGDAAIVRIDGASALIAVIDALGHGRQAAIAADAAVEVLNSVPVRSPVVGLLEDVHQALRGTRGAAATVCRIEGSTLEGCGVGNVEVKSLGANVPALLSPGILGAKVRKFRLFTCELDVSTRIVMYSDGLGLASELDIIRALSPADACRTLMDEFRSPRDDATVLVADLAV